MELSLASPINSALTGHLYYDLYMKKMIVFRDAISFSVPHLGLNCIEYNRITQKFLFIYICVFSIVVVEQAVPSPFWCGGMSLCPVMIMGCQKVTQRVT